MTVKKLLSLFLACFLLSACLVACKNTPEGNGESEETESVKETEGLDDTEAPGTDTEAEVGSSEESDGSDTESEETESEEPEDVFVSAKDLLKYSIVRADGANMETQTAVSTLYVELLDKYGDIDYITDILNKGESVPTDTKEILVGLTNREESTGLRYYDWEIAYRNDRIVINGGSGKAVADAVDYFLANCVADDGVTIPASLISEGKYPQSELKVNGELLKNFSIREIDGELDDLLHTYLGEQVGIYSKSPMGKEIILKTDSKYGVTEIDIYMENGNLILANASDAGDCSLAVEYFIEQIKNVQNGKITLAGNVSMTIDGFKTATNADIAQLRASTDKRIEEIRATENMQIPAGATVYYVSNNGSDSNNGKTPETAWATLSKVSSANLKDGDYVCFERGGIVRGKLTAKKGVTYTAYGTGDKPKLYGSLENGADPKKWKKSEVENIWYYDGGADWADVGTLVFNDGESCAIKAIKRWEESGDVYNHTTNTLFNNGWKDLNQDLHFYHDVGSTSVKRIYIYSEENPGRRFDSIEFNIGYNLITVASGVDGVTIDNLCLMYTGIHGIGANTVKDLTVQNCEFGWIGGTCHTSSIQGRNYQTRLGNAVEIYGGCENYTVQNNYIYQIYDAGVTHQVSSIGKNEYYHTNVLYLNNVIENCVYSIEYFVSGCEADNPSVMTNFRIEGNHMWYASRGFCEQRPPIDRSWGAHIKGRSSRTGNRANGYIIKDNIFVDGKDRLLQITSNLYNSDGSDSMPTFEGNIFVEEFGRKLGQVLQDEDPAQQIDAKFDFDALEYLNERTFGRSSGNEIWFKKQ